MPAYPGFIGPSCTGLSLSADAEECLNLYPEVVESGPMKGQLVLYSTPGLGFLQTLPDQPCRDNGLIGGDGACFCVSGSTLFQIFYQPLAIPGTQWRYKDIGQVGNDGAAVQMFWN